ncbi:hypothetical protein OF83DRAFT_758652 [Amylostereum chailletii]|nr:hypothetical protein OF83DRAFT_758652 [Amylostereum chailletii]
MGGQYSSVLSTSVLRIMSASAAYSPWSGFRQVISNSEVFTVTGGGCFHALARVVTHQEQSIGLLKTYHEVSAVVRSDSTPLVSTTDLTARCFILDFRCHAACVLSF